MPSYQIRFPLFPLPLSLSLSQLSSLARIRTLPLDPSLLPPHLIAKPPQPGINQYTCLLLARTFGWGLKPNRRREELTAREEENNSKACNFALSAHRDGRGFN